MSESPPPVAGSWLAGVALLLLAFLAGAVALWAPDASSPDRPAELERLYGLAGLAVLAAPTSASATWLDPEATAHRRGHPPQHVEPTAPLQRHDFLVARSRSLSRDEAKACASLFADSELYLWGVSPPRRPWAPELLLEWEDGEHRVEVLLCFPAQLLRVHLDGARQGSEVFLPERLRESLTEALGEDPLEGT